MKQIAAWAITPPWRFFQRSGSVTKPDTPEEHLAAAKRYHRDLYSALDKMDPVSPRVVYRGLSNLDPKTFEAIRNAAHIDIGAVSSTSWNVGIAADFAELGVGDGGQVLFALKSKSAVAIEEASAFSGERELVLIN